MDFNIVKLILKVIFYRKFIVAFPGCIICFKFKFDCLQYYFCPNVRCLPCLLHLSNHIFMFLFQIVAVERILASLDHCLSLWLI